MPKRAKKRKSPTPTKALKKMIYERDKGICRLCQKPVDPLDFDVGHNRAKSKGGKLTLRNALLLCPSCNRSMSTLTLPQAQKKIGIVRTRKKKSKKDDVVFLGLSPKIKAPKMPRFG